MKTLIYWGTTTWLLALAILVPGTATAGSVQPVSVPDSGVAAMAGGSGDSINPIVSADGRYILFASSANNLALTASNTPYLAAGVQHLNVYRRDRTLGTTTLGSVNVDRTAGGNGDSVPAGISADGRYLLFESTAGNLVPGDTNNASDIFLRDMVTGTTILVSARTNGTCANGASSTAVMTSDGRYIAFSSVASDLVDGDTNGTADIFVHDMQTGSTVLASPGALSYANGSSSSSPVLSADGRFVAFVSSATNLVPMSTGASEVYVRDLIAGVTSLASAGAHDWIQTNPVCYGGLISDDGRFVIYQANQLASKSPGFVFRYDISSGLTELITSNAVVAISGITHMHGLDLTPDGRFVAFVGRPDSTLQTTNQGVYLWDGQTGTTTLISLDTSGAATTNALCDWPALDSTAQHLAFLSTATNLTTNVVAGEYHLYVRDLQAGTTVVMDAGTNAGAGATAFLGPPRITRDGRLVVFDCSDTTLRPGDSNHGYDVFARDLVTDAVELVSSRQPSLRSRTAAGASYRPTVAVNGDGRWVVFGSLADDLTPNDANPSPAVFLRDLVAGTNLMISLDRSGLPVNGWLSEPSISADGRFVSFSSGGTNLAALDNNTLQDVFIRDILAGTNYLVSVASTGTGPGNNASSAPSLSASGQQVLFRSRAQNLAPVTAGENVFWRGVLQGRTYALTTSGAASAAMTPDGRYVVYGRNNGGMYLWDSQLAVTIYTNASGAVSNVAVSADGNRLAGQSGSRIYVADRAAGTSWTNAPSGPTTWIPRANLQFSADGQALVYVTAAPLVEGDTNGVTDVYLYDFQTLSNVLVSRSWNVGGAANGPSDSPVLSANGRFVAYRSEATDLVPGDTNGVPDVFLYDRQTGSTFLLSVSAFGNVAGNNRSWRPVFSGDGQTLVFQSWASDLVAQDFNQGGDVFAVQIATPGSISAFACDIVLLPSGGQPPTLSWPAQPGVNYRVEFKNDLTETAWQPLADASISVTGTRAYAADLLSGGAQRFYRVAGWVP